VISKYVLSEVIERAISILPRKEGWRVAHQMGESETCAKLKDMGKYFKRFSPFKMKSVLLFFITTCASCLAYAAQRAVSVESPQLGPVPQTVRSIIVTDVSFNIFETLHCQILGKKIPLSSDNSISTWFVTTSNACGWGAAVGPIWVVADRPAGNPSILLATGGYSLSITRKSRRAFASIAVNSGTAEENIRNRYFFDGKKYVRE
jgi:hypothetical protein